MISAEGPNGRLRRILVVAARSGEGPFTSGVADLSPRSPAIFGSRAESHRREPVSSSVAGRQLGFLPNMIQPPRRLAQNGRLVGPAAPGGRPGETSGRNGLAR